jgi:hypothetical protein
MRRRRRILAAAIGLCVVTAYVSSDWWLGAFGQSLVCDDGGPITTTLLLDNFDNEFGLFRRGAELERSGVATRVVVPVTSPAQPDAARAAQEVASAFARVAGLSRWEMVAVREEEPISLHTARRVRDFLVAEHIPEVTLVSSRYRSRRSDLIYRAVLSERGIRMTCMPLWEVADPAEWTHTWHGIENAVSQFFKLQYYRLWVMPVLHQRG